MSVILVAEQDAGVAEQIATVLESEGWTAEVVASRDAAFHAAATSKPRLLLASATLPEASSLLAAFSRQRGGPGAIVLVPAALAGRASAAEFHADLLLASPASDDDLKATVRSCLQVTAAAPKPILEPQASGQQLTSAEIFGDVLAEVEAEATKARRAASKERRRAASDEIERKLEETLSGVFPVGDKLKPAEKPKPKSDPALSPALEAQLPAVGRATKRPKRKVDLPMESEIDSLLDKTLSSLELPTRSRKTANRPTPAVAGPPSAQPPAAKSQPPAATPVTAPPPRPETPEPPAVELTAFEPPGLGDAPASFEPPAPPASEESSQPPAPSHVAPSTVSPGAISSDADAAAPDSVAPGNLDEPSIFSTTPMTNLGTMPFEAPKAPEAPAEGTELGEDTNPWEAPDHFLPADDAEGPAGGPPPSSANPPAADAFAIDGGDPWSELRGLGNPESFGGSREGALDIGFSNPEPPPPSPSNKTDDPGDSTNPWQSIEPPADLFPTTFADASSSGFSRPTFEELTAPDPAPGTSAEPPVSAPPTPPVMPPPVVAETAQPEATPPAAPSQDLNDTGTALDRFRSFLDQVEDTDSAPADAPSPTPSAAFSTDGESAVGPPPTAEAAGAVGPEAALQGVLELRGDSTSSAVSEVSPGQPFGDYTLLERIAVGGMAEVWRARRSGVEGFQKTVAIKKILSHLTDSPDFVNMFIDEAKLAAQLTHNNIIQIYDLGKVSEDFFIAMEYVDGRDLRTILKKSASLEKPLPMHLGLTIVAALAKALDYAHRKKGFDGRALGLVHRDVSPQNVLISYEGEIKLCDFGIVKAVAKASTTQMGALKGKLQYMSPEQAWGKSVDARSDIFSLGSVLFEVLTGEKLFIGDSEIGVLDAVRECRIRSLQDILPDLPTAVDDIVRKALAKDAGDRYQTAGDLDRDIQEVLRELHPSGDAKDLAAYMAALFRPTLEVPKLEPMGEGSAVYIPPPAAATSTAADPTGPVEDSTGTTPPAPPAGTAEATTTAAKPAGGGLNKGVIALVLLILVAAAILVGLKALRSGDGPATPPATTVPLATPAPETTEPSAPETGPQTTEPAGEDTPTADGETATPDDTATAPADGDTADGEDGLDLESMVDERLNAQQQELQDRLESEYEAKKRELEERLAETQQQIEESDPPPNNE